MHILLPLQKFVEPFNVYTVKKSQRIFNLDIIIHYIVDHSGYLISIESSDVLPDTTNVGSLMNHKQQSITILS
jgi:hypothetical protein